MLIIRFNIEIGFNKKNSFFRKSYMGELIRLG